MLFEISKELVKCNKFNLSYNALKINNTTSYKYLGWRIDQTITLNDRFEKAYRKMSSHILPIPLSDLTKKATLSVYQTKIVLLFLFNCTVNMNFTRTQMEKLHSLRKRMCNIIHSNCSTTENGN